MSAYASRSTRLLRHLAFVAYLAGFVVILCIVAGWLMLGTLRRHIDAEIGIQGEWFLLEDPEFGLRMRDGVSSRYRDPYQRFEMSVFTDDQGLRVAEAGARVELPVDVLFVGCSFTFGWGVEAEESMSDRFAELSGLRVANAATPAVGTQSAALAVRRLAKLRPRYVVYGLIDDHLRRNTCPCAMTPTPICQSIPYVRPDSSGALVEEPPIDSFLSPAAGMREAYLAARGESGFLRSQYWVFRAALGYLYRRTQLQCSRDFGTTLEALDVSLSRLSAESRAAGAQLVVAYIPQLGGIQSWTATPLANIALRNDLTLVSLIQPLEDYARENEEGDWGRLLIPNDVHPNRDAHAVLGRSLCRVFEDMGEVEPGRCGRPFAEMRERRLRIATKALR